jgi:hypothetical protein
MIYYNVTCNVSSEIAQEWIEWMKTTHLQEVMATGMFVSYTFCQLLTEAADNEGLNYTIQYKLETIAHLEQYNLEFGPALKQKTIDQWGEQVLAYRSVMEEV